MLICRGTIKEYGWGLQDGLSKWTDGATGSPQAELWFGVHPGGPSPVIDLGGTPTGQHLADHFDVEAIPLLVKLLAAARPLSVQVHPALELARAGWQAQCADPRAQPVFNDPFEKTELILALDDFEAFVGWRDMPGSRRFVAGIPGAAAAADALAAGDQASAIRHLLSIGDAARVALLPKAAREAGLTGPEAAAYDTVAAEYRDDAGALLTTLLQYRQLAPGEAAFLPAGVPHSYIRGTGLEVMTSSDNVIRLGLTEKPVFVEEALAALAFDLQAEHLPTSFGDLVWPVNSPFVVRVLEQGVERLPAGAYRIVLLIEGTGIVESELGAVGLRPGTAAVLSSGDPDARVTANGLCAVIQSTER